MPPGRAVLLAGLTAAGLVGSITAAEAQQGSVQVSTAIQDLRGDPGRLAGQPARDPDLGISWLQPGSRFGVFQMEIRGARRGETLHTGRIYAALRDLKYRGTTWTIEGGDAYFLPGMGEYRFSNLFAPAVTYNGLSITGHTARSSVQLLGGRSTAWRNIFGNDPQGLGQSIGVARLTHRLWPALELSARASRVRTSSLREFSYTIDAGDQVGGGAKLALTSSLQLVADGSLVSYRRTGATARERDGSYMGGLNWLHRRGWLQVNASRFSPGDFPALNNPLQDRQSLFAAGDYDLTTRTRASAGWETYRVNLRPDTSLASSRPTPQGAGSRGFGGLRLQVTSRSSLSVRGERGDRQSTPLGPGFASDSDTGSWAAEWQGAVRRTTAFVRYSARANVEHLNDSGSYDQRDLSAQLFANLSRGSQVFGTAMLTRMEFGPGGGNNYWQAGGGTQLRLPQHDLWLRAEGNAARNMDLLVRNWVPRETVGLGLNGQLSRFTTIALNVNLDRALSSSFDGSSWVTRSMLRVTRTMSTGSVHLAGAATGTESAARRGNGTISGTVFVDWNANGTLDPDDSLLEGIPLRLGPGHATTGRDGQFAFLNVPTGTREVGLDTGALPIDFDPPAVAQVQLELGRGDIKRVAFGLVPLGAVHGRVIRDANGNGIADPGEEPIDGAVLILDGGARSEQARKGRYQFDSVRSGPHLLKLLVESLPDGAMIAGEAEVPVSLTRGALSAEVSFLVAVEKRPEIRKVFPSRSGAASPANPAGVGARRPALSAAASPVPRAGIAARQPSAARRTSAAAAPPADASAFAVQIAALNDPDRANDLVRDLQATGMPAYLVSPRPADPDAPYRVRVGPYATRAAAQKTASALEERRGEKLWVTRAE